MTATVYVVCAAAHTFSGVMADFAPDLDDIFGVGGWEAKHATIADTPSGAWVILSHVVRRCAEGHVADFADWDHAMVQNTLQLLDVVRARQCRILNL